MKTVLLLFHAGILVTMGYGQVVHPRGDSLEKLFIHPSASAKPWAGWYWTLAGLSKEEIRADLAAIKEAGVGGAYLVIVKGSPDSLVNRSAILPSRSWNKQLSFALQQAHQMDFLLELLQVDTSLESGDGPAGTFDAHIYGRRIVEQDAIGSMKMTWNGYPGMVKTEQDRSYALGFNRLVLPVLPAHSPVDRRLDRGEFYLQKDQNWREATRYWMEYTQRCQWLLQQGRPVADLAIYTGDPETVRGSLPEPLRSGWPQEPRATLSEQLRSTLPGLLGKEADAFDPLRGYAYDRLNSDGLLRLATVERGQLALPGGGRYFVLVLPGVHSFSRDSSSGSGRVAERVRQLVQDGATVLVEGDTAHFSGPTGKGRVIKGPLRAGSLDGVGLEKDFIAQESDNQWSSGAKQPDTSAEIVVPVLRRATGLAYAHRTAPGLDIYFVSNQLSRPRLINLSLRVAGKKPELWNAVTGEITKPEQWSQHGRRTSLPVLLDANGSIFIVFRKLVVVLSEEQADNMGENDEGDPTLFEDMELPLRQTLQGPWTLRFAGANPGAAGTVVVDSLLDWDRNADSSRTYDSGTTVYTHEFVWKEDQQSGLHPRQDGPPSRTWLDLGQVAMMAKVTLNGQDCGVAWTPPYRVDITKALTSGKNALTIEVTNGWAKRPPGQDRSRAGLLGPVTIHKK